MGPIVSNYTLNSTAGKNLTVECIFMTADNLIRVPSVQWLNPAGSGNLTFSPLLTSDGGVYTCNVTINITELKITLSSVGSATLTVQSK